MADATNNNIQNEVVRMEFDGRNFEKNIQKSMETIRLLNSEILNLSKASLEFQKIEDASRNLKLDGITKAVDNVNDRFSLMGNIVQRVYRDIADSTVNLVKKMTTSFLSISNPFGFFDTANMKAGLHKYEEYNKAIRTMYNNLSADAKYAWMEQEELMQHIEKEMDYITTYSDETNAAIDKVVEATSKLTNAGESLADAQRHVVGYTNMLGSAGFQVEEINNMYGILDSITSSGRIMTRQYMQIAKTFTPQVRKLILEYAALEGTLNDLGGGYYETNVGKKPTIVTAGQEFRASLKDGWLTSSVYERVLDEYAAYYDAVKKLSDDLGGDENGYDYTTTYQMFTEMAQEELKDLYMSLGYTEEYFEQNIASLEEWQKAALDSTRQAKTFQDAWLTGLGQIQVGWKNTFTIIFGNVLEAEELWTRLANALYDFFHDIASWRNEFLRTFKEFGGVQYIIEGIANLLRTLEAIFNSFSIGIREAFGKYINAEVLANVAQAFYNITEAIASIIQPIGEVGDEINQISFVTQTVKLISNAVALLFKIIGKGIELVSPLVKIASDFLYLIMEIIGHVADIINTGIDSFISDIINQLLSITIIEDILNGIEFVFNKIVNSLNSVITFLKDIFINKTLIFIGGILNSTIGTALDFISKTLTIIKDIIVSTIIPLGSSLKNIFVYALIRIKDAILAIFRQVKEMKLLENILKGISHILISISSIIVLIIKNFVLLIEKISKNFPQINAFIEKIKNIKLLQKIGEKIFFVWNKIKDVFEKIKDYIKEIKLDDLFKKVNNFSNRIVNIFNDFKLGKISASEAAKQITDEIINAFTFVIDSIKDFFEKTDLKSLLMEFIKGIPDTIIFLGSTIYNLIDSILNNIIKSLDDPALIDKLANNISNFISKIIQVIVNLFSKIQQIGPKLKEVFNKVDFSPLFGFLDFIKNAFNEFLSRADLIFKSIINAFNHLFGTNFGLLVILVESWTRRYTLQGMAAKLERMLGWKWFFEGIADFLKSIAILVGEIALIAVAIKKEAIDESTLIYITEIILAITGFISICIILIANLTKGSESLFSDFYGWVNTLLRLAPIVGMIILVGIVFNQLSKSMDETRGMLDFFVKVMASLVIIFGTIIIGAVALRGAMLILYNVMYTLVPTGVQIVNNTHSLLNIFKSIGVMLVGIAAFIASLYLIQYLDPNVVAEKIEKVAWSIFKIVAALTILITVINIIANLIMKKNMGNITDKIFNNNNIFSSISLLMSSIAKIMFISYPLDGDKVKKKFEAYNSILLGLISFVVVLALVSKYAMGTETDTKNVKFIIGMMALILGEIAAILMISNFLNPKDMDKFTRLLQTIFTGFIACTILIALLSKSISTMSSIDFTKQIVSMITILVGIGGILFMMSVLLNSIKDIDFSKLDSSINILATLFTGIGVLIAVLTFSTYALKDVKDFASMITILIGIGSILFMMSELLRSIQGMDFKTAQTAIPLISTLIVGISLLALALSGASYIISKNSDYVTQFTSMITLIIGIGSILFMMSVLLNSIQGMELQTAQTAIPLLITVIGGVSLLALVLAGSTFLMDGNYTGMIGSIGGMLIVMLGIINILDTLKEAASSGALNQETVKAFGDILKSLGVAFGILAGLSAILAGISMTGVGAIFTIAFVAILGALTLALNGIAEAMKIFAEAANIAGDASIKFSNAFAIFSNGINIISNAITNVVNSIRDFITYILLLLKTMDPVQLLALSGSLTALAGSMTLLTGASVLLTPALFALSAALTALNIPFKVFIDTLTTAYNLGKDVFKAATNFISGFTGGIKQGTQDAFNSGKELGEAAVEGLNEGTDSHSPSRLAKINGEYFVIGMIDGIETMVPVAKERAEALGLTVVEGLENSVELSYDKMKELGYNTTDNLLNAIEQRLKDADLEVEVRVKLTETKEAMQDWQNELNDAQKEVNNFKKKNKIDYGSQEYNDAVTFTQNNENKQKARMYERNQASDELIIQSKIDEIDKALENEKLSETTKQVLEENKKAYEEVVNGVNKTGKVIIKDINVRGGGYMQVTKDVHRLAEIEKDNFMKEWNQNRNTIELYKNNNAQLDALQQNVDKIAEEGYNAGYGYDPAISKEMGAIGRALNKFGVKVEDLGFLPKGTVEKVYSALTNGQGIGEALLGSGVDSNLLSSLGLTGIPGVGDNGKEATGRLAATKNLLVEAQNEVNKLTEVYKKFGQDEHTAMFNAQKDTKSYYDYLYQLAKEKDENFDIVEVGTGEFDKKGKEKTVKAQMGYYEDALFKVFKQEKDSMLKSMDSQYDAFGFSTVEATTPKMDYATAKANIKKQTEKINSFVTGFTRLAEAGLSADLANVIQQEGYWNSPTYYILSSLSNEEIQKYQEAIDAAKRAYDVAQEKIANTHISINVASHQVNVKKQTKEEIDQNIADLKDQMNEYFKQQGISQEHIEKYWEEVKANYYKQAGINPDGTVTVGGNDNGITISPAQGSKKTTVQGSSSTQSDKKLDEAVPIVTDQKAGTDPNKDDPNHYTKSSLYNTIKGWVEDQPDLDVNDKEVKKAIKDAVQKDLTTEKEVGELFEERGLPWDFGEDADDNETESTYSTIEKQNDNNNYSSGTIYASDKQGSKKTQAKISDEAKQEGEAIGSTVVQGMGATLQEEGPGMIENVMNASEPVVIDSMIKMLNNLLQNAEFLEICKQIGNAISAGISVGMGTVKDDVEESGGELGDAATGAIADSVESASPSKVTTRIGKYIAEGLALGIRENTFLGTDAAYEMAVTTTDIFRNAFDNIDSMVSDEMNNDWSITPVVNMDNIEDANKDINKIFANHDLEMIASNKQLQNEGKNSQQDANSNQPATYTITQNNYSPKALSRGEIYRQTKNLFSSLSKK